jgi:hypothetical protein
MSQSPSTEPVPRRPAERLDADLDADPALTEALREVMRPRARWPLVLTVALLVALVGVAWAASHTVLASLWR